MARKLVTASLAIAALAAGTPAVAQSYPSKPIRMLVGFPAGGPSDVPARLIAAKMQAALGQPVVVENKTGAAGMIALKDMLAQPRDGHTLLLCSYIDAINPLIYKKVDYKLDEVVPVSLVQKAYYAIAVANALPVNSLKEFIAHAKSQARQAQLRPGRHRIGDRDRRASVREGRRHLDDRRDLPRHRAGLAGDGRRPARLHGRTIGGHNAALRGQAGQGAGDDQPGAARGRAAGADHEGTGRADRQHRLVGRVRGVGHAEAGARSINKQVAAAVNAADFKTPIEKTGVIAGSSSVEEAMRIWKETAADAEKLYKEIGFEKVD